MCNVQLIVFSSRILCTLLTVCLLNTTLKAQTAPTNRVDIVYAAQEPLKIAAVSQYPLNGFDINLIPESNRDSVIYNPVISENTRKLNIEAAITEKKSLAVGGDYLALICTSKTNCYLKANTVLARKQRVDVGYGGMGYPDHTEDGVTIQVKYPIKNTVLLLRGNLPTLKKDHAVKTWYANFDNLQIDKQNSTSKQKIYTKMIHLDNGKKAIVTGKPKEKEYDNSIDWSVIINNVERKLTRMYGSNIDLKDMSDVSDYLLWVGDLDGDNQPDLIINNNRGGELEYKLFLSTDIKPNKPWQPAATFDWFSEGAPTC